MITVPELEITCPQCGEMRMGKASSTFCAETFKLVGTLICRVCYWAAPYDIEQAQDDVSLLGGIFGSAAIGERVKAVWELETQNRGRA